MIRYKDCVSLVQKYSYRIFFIKCLNILKTLFYGVISPASNFIMHT